MVQWSKPRNVPQHPGVRTSWASPSHLCFLLLKPQPFLIFSVLSRAEEVVPGAVWPDLLWGAAQEDRGL